MPNIEVISFDLWNTLCYAKQPVKWDIEAEIQALWRMLPTAPRAITVETFIEAYKARSTRIQPVGLKTSYKEQRTDQIVLDVLRKLGLLDTEKLEKFAQDLISEYFKRQLKWIYIYPGVHDLLTRLKQKNYTLILISDHQWPSDGNAVLQKHDLKKYFTNVVFSGEIGYHKPSPQIFQAGVKGINLSNPTKLLHVGDDYYRDIEGIIKFGGKAVWIDSWTDSDYQRMKDRRPKITKERSEEIIAIIRDLREFPDV